MSTMKKIALGLLATSLLAAPVGAAFAQESKMETGEKMERSEADETAGMTQAKVQMSEAIAAAEAAVGGKAVDTGFEEDGGVAAWEVEIAQADGTTKTVLVDATTGKVDQNPAMDQQNEDGSENSEDAE